MARVEERKGRADVRLAALRALMRDLGDPAQSSRPVQPEVVSMVKAGADIDSISLALSLPREQVELDLLSLAR